MSPRKSESDRPGASRGSVLFEVMLSVALFVGAAAFCLSATNSVFGALDRGQRTQFAVDLARSKLAELEAGLVNIRDLRGEWSGAVGSRPEDDQFDQARRWWTFDVSSTRTEFQGLTLVELTVHETTDGSTPETGSDLISYTLRQLVVLRETPDEAYEEDDLLEGLPEVER